MSVATGFSEMGVGGEIQSGGMLEDKRSVGLDNPRGKHIFGDVGEPGVVEGRVGEHQVEGLLRRFFEVSEYIGTDDVQSFYLPFFHKTVYAPDGGGVLLNGRNLGTTPADELEGDGAGTGKQVEHPDILQFQPVLKDIEQGLAGHIGGGPYVGSAGRTDLPSSEFATNYPQRS